MKIISVTSLLLAALYCVGALAQSARPSDGQVEKLIEQAEKSAEDFDRALDRDLKNSTIRGPNGEVAVKVFLKDFGTDIDRMKERFDSKYAASAELVAILRRAGGLDTYIDSQPPSLKGRSEWDTFSASLNELAGAYGSSFPMNPDSPPRRMNDLEIQQASDAAVKSGQSLRKSLSGIYAKDEKEGKSAAEAQIDAMTKAAKGLKARVDDGKPASGEAVVFAESVAKVHSALGDHVLTADAKAAVDGITASLSKVEQAFGMPAQKSAEPVSPSATVPAATATASAAADATATNAVAASAAEPAPAAAATAAAEPTVTNAVAASAAEPATTEAAAAPAAELAAPAAPASPAAAALPAAGATAAADVATTPAPVTPPKEQ